MTDERRYAPPAAAVSDPEPQRLLAERPRQVRWALALLWVSLGLGMIAWYIVMSSDPEVGFDLMMIVITALIFGVTAWLYRCIGAGLNWARWLLLALVVVGLAAHALPLDEGGASRLEEALTWASTALDLLAMVLLFTRPGALWFERRPVSGGALSG